MSEQKVCPTCGTEYPLSERFCPRDGSALRSTSTTGDLLGHVIADRYHILKKLGEGGMGTVYLAEHVKMGRKSALKVMNPGMNTDPDAIARFNREASNASRLSHPNICGIYDFGETSDGMIYLAMEFIEGSSLTSLVEHAGALAPARAGAIVHQTADALQVAHDAGIVHRDLKPDNIMVAKGRDGSDLVKVVDFGIAKASSSDAQKVTKTGLVVGTPEYMSPEQLAGDKLDGRSDIYSLGLVAFNCLTGKLPFPAETVQEAMIMRLTDKPHTLAQARPEGAWTEELQGTLDHALARNADERYQSAAQFGREFAAAVADLPATAASEAGTLVLNAAGVPATRVRSSAKTQPMEAPPAARPRAPRPETAVVPERAKSKVPMIAGVGGLIAVAAAAVILIPKFGGTPAGSAIPPVAGDTAAQKSSVVQADTSAGGTGAANPSSAETPGGVTKTAAPLSRPVSTPTSGTPSNGGSVSAGDRLAGWLREIDNGAPDAAESDRVIRGVEGLLPSLDGAQATEAYYVRMLAFASNGDERTCDDARRVVSRHSDATKRKRAQEFLDKSC